MKKTSIVLLLIAFVAQACLKTEDPNAELREVLERQDIQISQHLQENNLTAIKDDFGIYRIPLEENPDGRALEQNDIAVVDYTITNLDGTLIGESGADSMRLRFDNNATYIPASLFLGLRHMREGERYQFYVPFNYAYNEYELANVFSKRSIIVLEMEVKNIIKNSTELRIADIATIERVLAENEEEADTLKPVGVRKVLLEEGEGEPGNDGDAVAFYYTGRLLDGRVFDSRTSGTTFSFTLGENRVIPGFEAAAKSMRKGEKARFYLPSESAYGASGFFIAPEAIRLDLLKNNANLRQQVNIPPYSILEFELELVDITRSPE